MKKFTVLAVLGLPPGTIVGLTHAQAEPRAQSLKALEVDDKAKMGRYEVTAPIQFKVGETIWSDAELNKAMATSLEPEDATRQKARDVAKAQAQSKDLGELRAKAKQLEELLPELERLRAASAQFETKALDAEIRQLREKANQWDEVQEELAALRAFVGEIEALPKELHDQVKAEVEKARTAAAGDQKK
ncbi:hypothetical protein [Ramlibacter sp. Leaf400]|uniref:hypothetical protein n=1 Tax=Ramlibacter sp. Leaf400 TaxID=1736365 RepID=UPI0006F71531|nr:hypothetical protein [Ramlibacter sp. Leaf400]KQT10969.1 hypothetical protein ASG30_09225 [Ramlibacter sp. Leaf400]